MAEIVCTTISLQGNINLLCARVCAKRDCLPCPAIHGRSYLVLIVLAISAGVYSGCLIAGFLGLQSSLGGQIMNSAPFFHCFSSVDAFAAVDAAPPHTHNNSVADI